MDLQKWALGIQAMGVMIKVVTSRSQMVGKTGITKRGYGPCLVAVPAMKLKPA